MKEINDIIKAYKQLDHTKHRLALATVIYVAGSSYRRTGARMLVIDNGSWMGGISGGCLEGDALQKANHCMLQNKTKLVRYDTSRDDEHQIGVGLGCDGIIDVLISPIDQHDNNNPIKILESCVNKRENSCLITVISSKKENLDEGKMYKYEQIKNQLSTDIRTDIDDALVKQKSIVKSYDGLSLFIEILPPALTVTLFGHNYDIYPLLKMGNELGWNMNVVCKASKMTKEMKALSNAVYSSTSDIQYDNYTAFVLMAHDYKTDRDNLLIALQSQVPFIGLLGPVKRKTKALDELQLNGYSFTEQQMNRLYSPIGLDIGSESPEEIALAILAEIRAHFSKRSGLSLRKKIGSIHNALT